jgi:hypothetical protein
MDASTLIRCWEHGRRRHPLDRALLLYAEAAPHIPADALADRTIGERNAALLQLRRALFGDDLKSCIDCPQCAEQLEFSLSASALLAAATPPSAQSAQSALSIRGLRVRPPTTRDLASICAERDTASAECRLLQRLCEGTDAPEITDELRVELERLLDAADPCLDLGIDLHCPACGHEWNASFDVPAFLWDEIETRARRLLDEVHVLARSYGWSERQILELSDMRRQAYLERALA